MIPAEVAAALPAAFDRASVSAHALVRCALDSPLGESHLIASGARVVVLTRSSSFEPFRFVELEDGSVRYEHEAFSRTLRLKTREGHEHRIDVSILDVSSVEAFVAALGGASPGPATKPASPIAPSSSLFGPSSSPFGPSPSAPFSPIAPRLSPPPLLESAAAILAPSAADPAVMRARTDLVTLLARRAAQLERTAVTTRPKPQEQKQAPAKKTQPKPQKQKQASPARRQGWKPPNPARRAELEAQMRAAAAGEPEVPDTTSDAPLFRRGHLIALLVGVPLLWTLAQLVARMVVKR